VHLLKGKEARRSAGGDGGIEVAVAVPVLEGDPISQTELRPRELLLDGDIGKAARLVPVQDVVLISRLGVAFVVNMKIEVAVQVEVYPRDVSEIERWG
jgi:hypothetical protein